jgi:hypothetical protein
VTFLSRHRLQEVQAVPVRLEALALRAVLRLPLRVQRLAQPARPIYQEALKPLFSA